jgi:hypothetical protein
MYVYMCIFQAQYDAEELLKKREVVSREVKEQLVIICIYTCIYTV